MTAVCEDVNWRLRSACRDQDPDLWTRDAKKADHEKAVQICGGCDVWRDCGEWALRGGDRHLIAAGKRLWRTFERGELNKLLPHVLGDAAPKLHTATCARCSEVFDTLRQDATALCSPCRQHFVSAEPIREHVRALRAMNMPVAHICAASGVRSPALWVIIRAKDPQRWVTPATLAKVLAVPIPTVPVAPTAPKMRRDQVLAVGTYRRLRALVAAGWSTPFIGQELRIPRQRVQTLLQARQTLINIAQHRDVSELYERLQDVPGPSGRARRVGEDKGWTTPAQWVGVDIDDPNAEPLAVSA